MKCGVRFCGGCNPRYDRGKAYEEIKNKIKSVDFLHAVEDDRYDCLLVIGGCTNCCASYDQFDVKGDVLKMWDQDHIGKIEKNFSAFQDCKTEDDNK
ncbi:MAG: hypothetical protein Q4C25_06810 [Bacillota bacterium]|nr:hypothetical protein [Bacillota bacterium]